MKHTVKNNQFEISVMDNGAELCSIRSKKTGKEYMWDAQSDVWGSHAPVLFPAIGAVRPEGLEYKGERYAVPRHGFIRKNEDLSVEQTANSISYTLNSNDKTRAVYPFEFSFTVCFQLEGNEVHVKHTVVNEGDETMLFSLGGHPAFKCPVNNGEQYEDYYLEFEQEENSKRWLIADSGLISSETEACLKNTKTLPLTRELFAKDALVFKDLKSKAITLKSKTSEQALTVTYDDAFSYMGIWAKPGGDFVCIEPWMGIADTETADGTLAGKEGIASLGVGKTFEVAYTIEIQE